VSVQSEGGPALTREHPDTETQNDETENGRRQLGETDRTDIPPLSRMGRGAALIREKKRP